MWDFITKLIDANALGGWVRAGVGALFAAVLAKSTLMASIFTPELQSAAAVLVSGVVVGIWSHIAKVVTPPPAK